VTNGFTPTQQAIVNVLNDGRLHSREELLLCLDDDLADIKTLNVHLCNIRKKLTPQGYLLDCVVRNRRLHYRWTIRRVPDNG